MKTINFEKYNVNEEQKLITFSCCSDYPYFRYDQKLKVSYEQILIVNQQNLDLTRLNSGAVPLLFNHNMDSLIGIVNKAYIIENKLFVDVKFRDDKFSNDIWNDIINGSVKNVSIGYEVQFFNDKKENGNIKRYVNKWIIYEVSIVSAPADPTVGVRAYKSKNKRDYNMQELEAIKKQLNELKAQNQQLMQYLLQKKQKEDIKVQEVKAQEEQKAQEDKKQQVVQEEKKQQEVKEVQEEKNNDQEEKNSDQEEIKAIGKDNNIEQQEVERAIKNKLTVRDFKRNIMENKIKINISNKGNKKTMKREFKEYLQNRNFETPFVLRNYSGWGGQTGQGGAALIGTETLPLVKILEKAMGVKGFRTLGGLTNNVSLPVQTGRNVAYVTDHVRDAATTSNPVFTNVTLTPHKISGNTRISKELLLQANDDVIGFVIDSLTRQIAYKVQGYMLDKVASGAGASVTYSALSAIDWDDILAFESNVATYNLTDCAFVMAPGARAALKGIEKAQNTAQFLCDGDNKINGYQCRVSGCVNTATDIYFGDWTKLILAVFGDMQVVINPYSYAKQGDVEVVASMAVDSCVQQSGAFVKGALTSSSASSESSASL